MMQPPIVVMQDEVLGAGDSNPTDSARWCEIHRFSMLSGSGGREMLAALSREATADRQVLALVSLPMAGFILRTCPGLARGILWRADRMRYHIWSSVLPREIQLNQQALLLPFAHIEARASLLQRMMGARIFLRPDSGSKVFPGMIAETSRLDETVSFLRQVTGVGDEDLVVLAPAQEIGAYEYRFWMAHGRPVTHAGYTFGQQGVIPDHPAPPCPPGILELAAGIADRCQFIETLDSHLVMDFCLDGQGLPRLVEVNAWSTSGLYPGADLDAIIAATFAG